MPEPDCLYRMRCNAEFYYQIPPRRVAVDIVAKVEHVQLGRLVESG